jgi:uncharacterized Ntn-hydrolase superfamily protein
VSARVGHEGRLRRSPLLPLALALAWLSSIPAPASATWSILAVDARTGRLVIASATCVSQANLRRLPARGLMDIQAIVVPGVGAAAAQAAVDPSRADQRLIYDELLAGTEPRMILELLRSDPAMQSRQFGIVDVEGRALGYSGPLDGPAALSRQGQVARTEIHYSVQGNFLASEDVVLRAAAALEAAPGDVLEKVMAAMEAADAAGGDRRCSCQTPPLLQAPCERRSALVAYLLVADADDPRGTTFNDGHYHLFLEVTDENISREENADPVVTLRFRFDAWRRGGGT